ncbi:MAG TPA: DegT/DnrJ/EryC1/StrS family aminotransferase [Spirochaetota bacterium]|nr:DegT/DnrJ/EryC1/StrS family aminotransferase [Spirochaetota bacterium]
MEIPFHRPSITEDEIEAVAGILRSGWLTMGKETIRFEEAFRKFTGAQHALAVNSCTAALHLSLVAAGIEKGDEVILPVLNFISSAEVIAYCGGVPVFVDVNRDDHNIDTHLIEEKITENTRAIMPMHFGGQPADMDSILCIAEKHALHVIEDAAHALPSIYGNTIVGSIGDATCFSFYATKTLTTGEGGMITTDNDEWADRIKSLRLHGITHDAWKRYSREGSWIYDVRFLGYKYNTTDFNAALGLVQLARQSQLQKKREAVAAMYTEAFSEVEELIPFKIKKDRSSSWHLYPLKLRTELLTITRDEFIDEMKSRGISTSVHFIPIHHFSFYKNAGYGSGEFPETDWIFERTVSLPIYPDLVEDEIAYIIENVIDIITQKRKKTPHRND